MELRDGDVVSGKVIELVSSEGRARYGCAYPLQEGRVFSFDPHRRHAVLPWKGERIAIVGYTPGMLASVPRGDREVLWALQFPLPLEEEDAVPEVYINALSVASVKPEKHIEEELVPLRGGGWQEVIATSEGDYLFKCDWVISKKQAPASSAPSISRVEAICHHEEIPCESWSDWEMHLVLDDCESGLKTAVLPQRDVQEALVRKAEVAYTEGVESIRAVGCLYREPEGGWRSV